MAKDPAFLFYPGDWLGGTMGMTFQEKGAYMELLLLQFNTGPFTESYAKRMLSVEEAGLWDILRSKFKTDGSLFWSERLSIEIDKRKSFVESRRLAGLTPKKPKKAYAKRTEDENIDENIDINSKGGMGEKYPFDNFWLAYDKKEGREICSKKWNNLTDEEKGLIMAHVPKYVLATPNKKYRKMPATYLNQKTWLDEELPTTEANKPKSALKQFIESHE